MESNMKDNGLKPSQVDRILRNSQVGSIATIGPDGYPYVVPVHFAYVEGKIYIHGLPAGTKIDNLVANEKVGFEVHYMGNLILSGNDEPSGVNTEFESVIITGNAKLLHNFEVKEKALYQLVTKYSPSLKGKEIPENMVEWTGVIEITINTCTGKYYG